MKLDVKSILILVLLAISLFFGYKWFFGGNSEYKEKVKQLEKEFQELENQKKKVDLEISSWRSKFDSLSVEDRKLKQENIKLESQTRKAELEANKSKANLDRIKGDMKETQNKIEEFKKNPPNRTGDALLESLKNKTNNK